MERSLNIILNIAILLLFGLLIMSMSGFAYAEPYQIPDRNWDSAQNCSDSNDGKFAGKHYMMATSRADGMLRIFCMKAPVKLPNGSWDHAIGTELLRLADRERNFPKISYVEIAEINSAEKRASVILYDALTGEKYQALWIYP